MTPYIELLRDPRWQKKRLEVMQLANFACQQCDETTKTLNVHHKAYRRGAKPWEYEASELECLCEGCHELRHQLKNRITANIAKLDAGEMMSLLGYLDATITRFDGNESINILDGEHAIGIGHYYGIGYVQVMELMKGKKIAVNDIVNHLGV
jgi:hypothetical protein